MSGQRFNFEIYKTPKSMNDGGGGSRTHWAVGHREKRAWEEAVMTELMVAKVPRAAELAVVHITLHWKDRLRRDVTNYYSTVVKPLADALVKRAIIADDTDDLFRVASITADHPKPWPAPAGRLGGYVSITLEVDYP